MPQPTARKIERHADRTGPAVDHISLGYEARFLRRRVLHSHHGLAFLVDLAQVASLDHGDAFVLDDGDKIEVFAAPEPLLEIRGPDLLRLAWHIGNRHTPCQIEADRLMILRDHVLADMLSRLGAELAEITAPFVPEGGAYGHGRTHGHDHHATHGPETQTHDHTHS